MTPDIIFSKVIFEHNYAADYFSLSLSHSTVKKIVYFQIRPLSYQDADLVMFCYDIGQPQTFRNIASKWVSEVEYYVPTVARFLVGESAQITQSYLLRRATLSSFF